MRTDGTSAALLQATCLSKSFGAARVLLDVSFDLQAGEVLGIPGPNGAGKTTLFNLISGDLRNDTGGLTFAGQTAGVRAVLLALQTGRWANLSDPQAIRWHDDV